MHVLYYHLYFNLPEGSGSNRPYRFCRRLVERGHTVTAISAQSVRSGGLAPGLVVREGITLHVLDVSYRWRISMAERLHLFWSYNRKALRQALRLPNPPDVVFASSTPLTIGIPGYRAARHFGVPFVFEVRDLWPHIPIELGLLRNPLLQRAARALEHRIYNRADAIIALSPGFADGIARTGYPRDQIALIPNGSELDRFDPEARSEALRRAHGWTDKVVVLHAGSMGMSNGLDQVLETAHLLQQAPDPIQFVFIGTGNRYPHLAERARSLPNVTILDPLPRADIVRYWQAADVGLTSMRPEPALFMNSANKFFEGLAAGRPVITNYPGWQADWLRQYDAGLSTRPGDARDLADALIHLARNPDVRRTMGRHARRLAEDQFDTARQSDQFVDLLEQVVRSRERTASRNG